MLATGAKPPSLAGKRDEKFMPAISEGRRQHFIIPIHAAHFHADMQSQRAVDAQDRFLHAGKRRQHALEAVHKFADGGNEIAVHAFRKVAFFVAFKDGNVQGRKGIVPVMMLLEVRAKPGAP